MTNVITLADIEAAIEQKYAPCPIQLEEGGEIFILQSLLRCDEKVREAVITRMKDLGNDATDAEGNVVESDDLNTAETVKTVQFVLKSVTKDGRGTAFVKALGNDLLKNMTVLQMWTAATQPGEATDSPA